LISLAAHQCLSATEMPVQQTIKSFQQLCATGPLSPEAVLAKADAQGWRRTGRDAPATFDPKTQRLSPLGEPSLLLIVATETSYGEQRDSCGIGIAAPTRGLAAAVRDWLGFAPTFAMALSATYAALRTGDDWRSGSTQNHAEFAKAKAEGRFYSIMVADRGTEEPDTPYPASVMLLRVQPAPQAHSGH
jgi:hypothetical protein